MSKYERAALKKVNKIRRKAGVPKLSALPPGSPGMSYRCVIANALKDIDREAGVGKRIQLTIKGRYRRFSYSPMVAAFISQFDHGKMPHLDGTKLSVAHPKLDVFYTKSRRQKREEKREEQRKLAELEVKEERDFQRKLKLAEIEVGSYYQELRTREAEARLAEAQARKDAVIVELANTQALLELERQKANSWPVLDQEPTETIQLSKSA